MIDEQSLWLKAKNDYLGLIEHALAEVEYPKRYEILTQVAEHLEQKYAELPPASRTWESFRQIITEMGPPEDYAVLLHDDIPPQPAQPGRGVYKLLATLSLVVLSAAAVWLIINGPKIFSNWFPPAKPVIAQKFQPDQRVLGKWFTVDFVKTMDAFTPAKKVWQGDLYLKSLDFEDQGVVQWCTGDDEQKSKGCWTCGKVDPNDPIPGRYEIRDVEGSEYLFVEWISGDVIIRGQKPCYYVLEKTSGSSVSGNRSAGRPITVGADCSTMAFVESKMGPAERREERMLRYPSKGIDFTFTNGILSEFHLNKGYTGQLKTGISLTSTSQEVFRVYGQPIKTIKVEDLHRKNDERILYRNDVNMSRIYYGRHGMIFWFRDDIVLQIVVFKGEVSPVF